MATATESNPGTSGQSAPEQPATGHLTPGSLVLAGLVLDALLVTPVIWALARADGISLWPADQSESLLFLFLPTLLFTGAWGAQAFALRQTRSFLTHIARSVSGALIAALLAFALFLAFGGVPTGHMAFIAAAGIVLVGALHTNYLGTVRSLIRAGIVQRLPEPADE